MLKLLSIVLNDKIQMGRMCLPYKKYWYHSQNYTTGLGEYILATARKNPLVLTIWGKQPWLLNHSLWISKHWLEDKFYEGLCRWHSGEENGSKTCLGVNVFSFDNFNCKLNLKWPYKTGNLLLDLNLGKNDCKNSKSLNLDRCPTIIR